MPVATVTVHLTRVGPVSTRVDAEPGAMLLLWFLSTHQLSTHRPTATR